MRHSWQKPYESLMGKSCLQVLDAILRTPEDEQREGDTEYRYYVIADGNLLDGLGTTTEWDKKGNPRPSASCFAQREFQAITDTHINVSQLTVRTDN